MVIGFCDDDLPTMLRVAMRADGQLEQESPYYRGEEWHGVLKRWYNNGNPEYLEHWVHGKQHGTAVYWNEDGSEYCREEYTNGVLVTKEPSKQLSVRRAP